MVTVEAPRSSWLLDWVDQHSWVLFCSQTRLWLYDVMLVPETVQCVPFTSGLEMEQPRRVSASLTRGSS